MVENPILEKLFIDLKSIQLEKDRSNLFSINGVTNKTLISLGIVTLSCAFMWFLYSMFITNITFVITMFVLNFVAMIGASIIFLTFLVENEYASSLTPLFAFFEGIIISSASFFAEKFLPGVVIQAVTLTLICFFSILILYKNRFIKYSQKLQSIIVTMFIAYILFNVFMFFSFFFANKFFMSAWALFLSNPLLYITVTLIIMIFIILSFLNDFNYIENAIEMKMDSDAEWYAAFGLTFKLVWLYLKSLELISYLRFITKIKDFNDQ